MSSESVRTHNQEHTPPSPDIFDRAVPPTLQEAISLTYNMLGDILENEAKPPPGIQLMVPQAPDLDFSQKDNRITIGYFRLRRDRGENVVGNLPSTTLELGLFHDANEPGYVELKTVVRIEQTQIYDLGKNATEQSTIVLKPPIHIIEEGEVMPKFDMTLISVSEDAKEEFRAKVAADIRDSYNYINVDVKSIEGKRKNRLLGTPLKPAAAA